MEMVANPLVSVIMPAYNDREAFLRESIESILNQTYQNLELIIADDSTEKKSRDIIDEYAAKDSRIRIVRSPERMGVCKALNKAIAEAKGEFIAHMDADDVSMLNRLELQMPLFNDNDIAVVGGQTYNIDPAGCIISSKSKLPCENSDIKKGFELGKALISNPTSIIRKKIFTQIGGYEELYKCSEDYDFWYRVAILNLKYANVPDAVLNYRIHGNNAHVRMAPIQSKLCCMTLIKYSIGYYKRMTKEEYNYCMNYVDNNRVCRIIVALFTPGTMIERFARRLSLYNCTVKFSLRYFLRKRHNLLSNLSL